MRRQAEDAYRVIPPSDRWQAAAAGRHYRDGRWRGARAEQRDLSIVRRILRRHGIEPSRGGLLDAPCGSGRLHPMLSKFEAGYVGLDVSESMLGEARGVAAGRIVRGSITQLPFDDDTFDVVVACRMLHHVHERAALVTMVRELVRTSRRLVIASFWDTASLPALRRRIGLRSDEGPSGRRSIPKPELSALFAAAGAEIVGFHHSFRFVSQQTFLVARKFVHAPESRARRAYAPTFAPHPASYAAEGVIGRA